MNKQDKLIDAVENSIEQWTFYAETGAKDKCEYKPVREANLLDRCYLCQYSSEITGEAACRDTNDRTRHPRCQACPYFKKYGFCCDPGQPAERWLADVHDPKEACLFAEQLKTLIWEVRQDSIAQLAEKPKLRHGDYGINEEGKGRLATKVNQSYDTKRYNSYGLIGDGDKHIECLGNIFDDLAALSEPLEEFTLGDGKGNSPLKASIWLNRGIQFGIGGVTATITHPETVHEIILSIRRMEATLKAKQDEK